MATSNEDLARLIVSLEVSTTRYFNELRKASQQTNRSASDIERRLANMSSRVDRTFANLGQRMRHNLTAPLAGVGAAFSTREIIRYADTWTEAGNRVAAAGEIIGMQGRSLSQIREIADDGRAGFQATIELYSRLLRSAGGVAESEEEIARATELVTKAFKAGGAATSEMKAGIMQLGQGLSSGFLQGDELRSVRENAPVLVNIMARYFDTTIGGLKEMGAQGELTSDQVFKAILSGEREIRAAFGTTRRTISDGFTLVENALIEYIGNADKAGGVTMQLVGGLTALADNFDVVADGAVKAAAIIAGVLVGRGIFGMVKALGGGIASLGLFIKAINDVRTAGAGLGTVFAAAGGLGPIAALVGGSALLAMQQLTAENARVNSSINSVVERMEELGLASESTAFNLREVVEQTEALAEAERKLRARQASENVDALTGGNFARNFGDAFTGSAGSTATIIRRAETELNRFFGWGLSQADKTGYEIISRLAQGMQDNTLNIDQIEQEFQTLSELDLKQPVIDLGNQLGEVYRMLDANRNAVILDNINETEQIRELRDELANVLVLFANTRFGDTGFIEDLNDLIDALRDSEMSAEDAEAEISRLAGMNPNFGNHTNALQPLIDRLLEAVGAANLLRNALESLSNAGPSREEQIRMFREADAASLRPITSGQEWLDIQTRLNNETEYERDLREEIEKLRKRVPDGSFVSDPALEQLAKENLAWKEANKKSSEKKEKKSDAEKFFDNLKSQEKENQLLQDEYELLKSLDPLAADHTRTINAWKKEQELLNAAKEAGITLDEETRARISELAQTYAEATDNIDRLQEAQEEARRSMQEWFDLAKSATRSFIDDLIAGKTAAEALGNALNQIGSFLINLGLNSIFGTGQGQSPFGIFTGMFPGRERGGSVNKGQPYIVGEKRPELFVPTQPGVIIPRVPQGLGSNSMSSTNVPISISIDATGADGAALARVYSKLAELQSTLPQIIQSQVQRMPKKGIGR